MISFRLKTLLLCYTCFSSNFTGLASAIVGEEGFGGVVKAASGKTAENGINMDCGKAEEKQEERDFHEMFGAVEQF